MEDGKCQWMSQTRRLGCDRRLKSTTARLIQKKLAACASKSKSSERRSGVWGREYAKLWKSSSYEDSRSKKPRRFWEFRLQRPKCGCFARELRCGEYPCYEMCANPIGRAPAENGGAQHPPIGGPSASLPPTLPAASHEAENGACEREPVVLPLCGDHRMNATHLRKSSCPHRGRRGE